MAFPGDFKCETSAGETRYVRACGYCAVHGCSAEKGPIEGEAFRFDPAIAICDGESDEVRERMPQCTVTDVYRIGEDGPIAVPTGSIYVRLSEGEQLENRQQEIAQAGFEIERVSPAIRYAGWVRHVSGRAEDSLREFSKLTKLTGIEAVEPQMLMARQRKR